MIFDKKIINKLAMIGQRASFGLVLYDLVSEIDDLLVLTADVSTSAGLDRFRKNFPNNYIDCGIAEQNMMNIAAGLASENFNVVTTSFAPFQTMRCLEQIKVNLGYMKNKVTMVGLASGLVLGPLGYTHCCIEDLSVIRSIPNINIISPSDTLETAKATIACLKNNQSSYIRLTGGANRPKIYEEDYEFQIGMPVSIIKGEDILIISNGQMVHNAKVAVNFLREQKIYPSLLNFHTLKPINEDYFLDIIKNYKLIFTVEEHSIIGGLFSTITETIAKNGINKKIIPFSLPDSYSKSGNYDYMISKFKLDSNSIAERIKNELR